MKYLKHIAALLCISLTTVLIFLLFYVKMIDNEEKRCWQELKTTVQDLNREISIKFNDEISKLKLIETILVNEAELSARDLSYLHIDKVQPDTMFERIDILYPDNTILSNGELVEVDENIEFSKVLEKGEYLTGRKTDFMNGKPCIYYVLPVEKAADISAVIIGVIDLDVLSELFRPVIYNGKANVCIIDTDDGNYIMDNWHSELGNVYEMEDRELLDEYKDVDFKEEIFNRESGSIAFVSMTTGKDIYMYYSPLDVFGWETAVFATEDVLFSNLVSLKREFVVAGVLELLLIILYFFWNACLLLKMQRVNRESEKRKEQLWHLSCRDMLTRLYNRYKFNEILTEFKNEPLQPLGVAYIDLNGLKSINDLHSHEAGDEYICKTARVLEGAFPECCYRIGGDEFVVIALDISEEAFAEGMKRLKEAAAESRISISAGDVWKAECADLNDMLHEVEQKMYAEKREYYKIKDTEENITV